MSLTCSSARNTVALIAMSACARRARLVEGARAGLARRGIGRAARTRRLVRGVWTLPAARTAGVLRRGALDAQRLSGDPHLLQVLHQFARHAFGQVDQAVVVADVDAADVPALQVRLVGDRADDVARLHAVRVAD